MVSIFRRKTSSKLYLQYKVDGKIRQKSTGLDDTPANRRLLKNKVIPALESKIVSGELSERTPEIFNIYADMYIASKDNKKTALEIARKVERLKKRFGKMPVDKIKRRDVKEFAAELLKTVSPKTVRGYIGIIRAILNIAIDYEDITVNPAYNIELPTHRKKEIEPFTPDEVSRLIDAADGWFKNFLAISFYTGLRTGEALALMQKDIDFDTMQIRVERSVSKGIVSTPKTTNGIRYVPIFENTLPFIKVQIKTSKSLYLFPGRNGKCMHGSDSLKKRWKKACEDAGVEYRKIYATRHTFITSMLKSGMVSVLELAQMVGHANTEPIIKNYARYIKGEHLKIDRGFDPFCMANQLTLTLKAR